MPTYQVTAIRTGAKGDHDIDALMIDGRLWPIEVVIEWVRTGVHRFWVETEDSRVPLVLRRHRASGCVYLTTEGSGFPSQNLLALRHIN